MKYRGPRNKDPHIVASGGYPVSHSGYFTPHRPESLVTKCHKDGWTLQTSDER